MATPKSKTAAKSRADKTDTSAAAVPGSKAVQGIPSGAAGHNVSAQGATQVAPQAITPQAGQSSSDDVKVLPPAGGKDPVATHVVVVARWEGFRRAGRAWRIEPTTVAVDEFSDEQLEALLGEPALSVSFRAE